VAAPLLAATIFRTDLSTPALVGFFLSGIAAIAGATPDAATLWHYCVPIETTLTLPLACGYSPRLLLCPVEAQVTRSRRVKAGRPVGLLRRGARP